MNKSIFQLIKLGRKFVNYWPERPELSNYFAEYRAVAVTRMVCRYLPPLAFAIFATQVFLAGYEYVSTALIYFIFFNSIPVQALLMMGKKSQEQLPPSLASWYREGLSKLKAKGEQVKLAQAKPKYIDLAHLLSITYRQQF